MDPINISQNFNPKNQLSFVPCQPTIHSESESHQIKIEEIAKSEHSTETTQFYSAQIRKLFEANTIIRAQLLSALEEKKIILELIAHAQRNQQNPSEEFKDKRCRRSAKEIERKFKCAVKGCEKSYGTEGSLVQHIRLKHPKTNSHDPPLDPPLNAPLNT